jgi:hypothetical protein
MSNIKNINTLLCINTLISLLVFASTIYDENSRLYLVVYFDYSWIFIGPFIFGFLSLLFLLLLGQLYNLMRLRYFIFFIIPLIIILYNLTWYIAETTFLSKFSTREILFFEFGIFVLIVLNDFICFFKFKRIIQFIPTVTGVFALSIITSIYQFKIEKFDGKIRYKAESIFADKHDEITDYEIIFKKNEDYILMKNEDDMATYYYYGTYKIDDEFITLTGDVSKEFTSKKFKIIVEKNQKNNEDSLMLVQIDNNSKAKKGKIKFNFNQASKD